MTTDLAPDSRPLPAADVRVGPEEDRPDRPPRRLPTAARIALAVLAMIAAAFAPAPLMLIPGVREVEDPRWGALVLMTACLVPTLVAIGLVALLMRHVDRRPLAETGLVWNRRSLPMLLLGTGVAVAVVVAVSLALDAAGLVRDQPLPRDVWWLVVPVGLFQGFLLQGFPEELVWRGYVLQTLRTRPEVSVVISAAVFGVMHLISQGGQENALERVLYLAVPFGFAMLAGALVLRTGSLWSAVGVHGGVHLGSLVATYLGIGEGPAYWIVTGALFTALGVLVLRRPRRS